MNKLRELIAKAKPLSWSEAAGQWDESGFGFSIVLNTDCDHLVYEAAWGEGDTDEFSTLADAKEWCQKQADDFIKKNAAASEYADDFVNLIDAAQRVEKYVDAIVCYASTMDEHKPNRIANDLRAALSKLTEDK